MKVRRVVTGHDGGNKAVFVSDEVLEPVAIPGGPQILALWGGDEAPKFPDEGSPLPQAGQFPPVGGFRFLTLTFPPGLGVSAESAKAQAAMAAAMLEIPGMHPDRDRPGTGRHFTETLDFVMVVSGEVSLALDEGAEVHLKRGDTVILNGTMHSWHNKGKEPAVIVASMVGAHHGS